MIFPLHDERVNSVEVGNDVTVRYVINKRWSGLHKLVKNGVFGCEAMRSLFHVACNPLLRDADGKTAADLLDKHIKKFPIENPRAQLVLEDMRLAETQMLDSLIATQIPKIADGCRLLGSLDAVTLSIVLGFL